jgi:hypothetical protein
MPYTFSHTRNRYDSHDTATSIPRATITYELHDDDLDVHSLLDEFHNFAKGCGFYVDHGTFQFVENEQLESDYTKYLHPDPAAMGFEAPESVTENSSPSSQMEFNFGAAEPKEEPKGSADV